ncbi:MAG: hypothetical protein H6912_05470 [Kordiimonadaceae bacterium]|nr:hypothetical protein [Kordiimonadaceae bacterium]
MTILASMLVFLSALSAGTNFPASMSDKEKTCLLTVWQRTLPSDEEKQFDMDHDVDIDGNFYSCRNNITASELQKSLTKIKTAIKNDDEQAFASMLIYPFVYTPKRDEPDKDGSLFDYRKLNNASEIHQHYKAITTPLFRDVMACSSLSKMSASRNFGILLARGYIYFDRDKTSGEIKMLTIHAYTNVLKEWLKDHCE